MNPDIPIEHSPYIEPLFTNRFIKHPHLKSKMLELKDRGLFKVEHVGNSVQQREIYQLSMGNGPIKVMLWSQMHGDEPTGTLAFFDLFNFFKADDQHNHFRKTILDNCTLYFIPLVNPDGAAVHQRRNAQNLDINRDFVAQQTPEGRLLIQLHQNIKPDFCFNMHDQENLWSVTGRKQPASISLLAPPADAAASLIPNREKAMQVIAAIHQFLAAKIPGSIGRWSEDYEPRAFGDNFQKLGSATILIESGGYDQDFEKQHVRKLHFELLLQAFNQIATGQYTGQQLSAYYSIPTNNKELFHLLIRNCKIAIANTLITADIGLNYTETVDLQNNHHQKTYTITDLGDLSTWNAYEIIEARGAIINAGITLGISPTLKIAGLLHLENGIKH